MSEITLSLEHPSIGYGEVIARYDLSEIQKKAYQQGKTDMQKFVEVRCRELGIDYTLIFTCIEHRWKEVE